MRLPRRSGALACILALTLAAASARAEDGGTDPAEERARALFDQGKEAMAVGRFSEAKDRFEGSLALVPRASPAFNLAVALRGMGRPKEASDVLAGLLTGRYGELPAERRHDVEALLAEASRDVATLNVVASGAPRIEIRVEGRLVVTAPEGALTAVRTNPGEQVVTFSAKQRDTVERRVIVAAGRSAEVRAVLTLSREARRGTLVVMAERPDDVVEIVGVGRGRGKLSQKVEPGTYTLRITSGGRSRESRVRVLPATEHRVVMDSPKPGVFASPWFWVAAGTVVLASSTAGYFLLRTDEPKPVRDSEFQVVQTLHGAPAHAW